MIYTVTFNPAVDYIVRAGSIVPGSVNRAESESIRFGGKGINVSIVLARLGIPSEALGFIAGFTGDAIERGVAAEGVQTGFVRLGEGFSRINVKLRADVETEINGQGPAVPKAKLEELFERLREVKPGDTLVLAGSVPGSLPGDIYERIAESLHGRGVRLVADAEGKLLLNVLKAKPFLVKPNLPELGAMFGVKPGSEAEIVQYADRLREMGAVNVLVSMAGDGAILVDEFGKVHRRAACKGSVKSSVGAGDSMVAGFIAGLDKGYDFALKLGTASGGAAAFSDGLPERGEIFGLLERL